MQDGLWWQPHEIKLKFLLVFPCRTFTPAALTAMNRQGMTEDTAADANPVRAIIMGGDVGGDGGNIGE